MAQKIIAFVLLFSFSMFSASPILARSITDVQSDISVKQSDKAKIDTQLAAAKKELAAQAAAQSSAQSEVDKLKSSIAQIDTDLKIRQLQMQQWTEDKSLKELQKEEQEQMQDLQVSSSYLSWKTNGPEINTLLSSKSPAKELIYNQAVNTEHYGGILGIAQQIKELEEGVNNALSESTSLQNQLDELAAKKTEAEKKLATEQEKVAKTSATVKGLSGQSRALQTDISFLSKEQQSILKREDDILRGATSSGGGNVPLQSGQFYFQGRGSNFVTGHGVGLSQWGAYGAARNAGMNYKQIVEFYFPGAKVMTLASAPTSVNVNGYGSMSIETYVAGLGEVGDKACEDNNNASGCWPKEAIKAQIVVARTYGARRSGGICTSASCQVYKGGTAKQWAADATAGEYVVWNNSLADVYYSADNNEGFGNADKETIWGGSRIPYLTSVNDNAFAARPYFGDCKMWCGNWVWRTNSYTMVQLKSFLDWARTHGYPTSFGATAGIGDLVDINLGKDPSNRVNKITVQGTVKSATIEGWMFKAAWNDWVNQVRPSGQKDLMFSFSYAMFRV